MPKLPNPLPKIKINLIPQDPFMSSVVGKFLVWSLSIGRYIVILTELVVILSFLSRFKLDRDLTDVNEAIEAQKTLIKSYGNTEAEFVATQAKINFIKKEGKNHQISSSLDFIEKNLPIDVKLTQLNIQPLRWFMSASAMSAQGMKATVDQVVQANPQADVSLGKVKLNSQTGTIDFDINVDQKTTIIQKPASKIDSEAEDSGI